MSLQTNEDEAVDDGSGFLASVERFGLKALETPQGVGIIAILVGILLRIQRRPAYTVEVPPTSKPGLGTGGRPTTVTYAANDGLDVTIVTVELPTLVGLLGAFIPGGTSISNIFGQATGQKVTIHASDLLLIAGLGIAISPFLYQLIKQAGGAGAIAGAVAGL